MGKKLGKCKLCLQEKDLIGKSHIIPDFMYRDGGIYHQNHTIKKIDLGLSLKGKTSIKGMQQSGEYDGNILCIDCERKIIGNLESYAKEFLFKGPTNYQLEKNNVLFLDIDYKKMKLFFLSIFWRASISRRPFFSEINPDEDIIEDLRTMIFTGNPMEDNDYPIYFIYDLNKTSTQYIGQPIETINKDGYFFPMIGILAYYSLDQKCIPNFLKDCKIFSNGQMRLFCLPDGAIWELFKYLY